MSGSFLALLASLALLAWALFGLTLKVVLAPLTEIEQRAEDIAAQIFASSSAAHARASWPGW